MTAIRLLPQDDRTNGWNNILPARCAKPELVGDLQADWVVVGAGFAGLAAARRLAENRPGDRIALLEAQEIAGAASGRNAGFAIDLPHGQQLNDGLPVMRRHMRLARSAIDYLQQQVDCERTRQDDPEPEAQVSAVRPRPEQQPVRPRETRRRCPTEKPSPFREPIYMHPDDCMCCSL